MAHSPAQPGNSRSIGETEVQKELEEAFEKRLSAEPWKGAGLYGSYLSSPADIRGAFLDIWPLFDGLLERPMGAEKALDAVRDLVIYEIPDGTRTTLSTSDKIDVELEAGMWCLAFMHTLRSLGATKVVLMTHTAYNRERGEAEANRIVQMLEKGAAPLADYCANNNVDTRLVGMSDGYELSDGLKAAFPRREGADFEAFFLVDYREEAFLEEGGKDLIAQMPDIDVVVRHTKMHISGGWLPTKTLRSTYLYSQNGTVYTNWTYDEHVSLVASALLAKLLNRHEILSKTYPAVDEVKKRYQKRELMLSNRQVSIRKNPKKLYVMSSPWGLVQIYF